MLHSQRFKQYRQGLSIIICLLACIAAARFCHHQTKGFRLSKIQNNLYDLPSEFLSGEQIDFIRSLFAYKFHYFGRGHQSFVFLSEDQEHVIKIFNNANQSKITFFQTLAHLPPLRTWALSKVSLFENKLDKTFSSYTIAFDEMKDKTGLLFIHLHKTDTLPCLTIVDPLHISHRLNPNELGFLIQKKAQLIYPTLEKLIEQHEMARAREALSKLLEFFIWKCRHGIHDNDPLIRTNFGFLEEEVIQIDVGPLSKDSTMRDPKNMRQEILRITASLKNWLAEHSPELLVYLNELLCDFEHG